MKRIKFTLGLLAIAALSPLSAQAQVTLTSMDGNNGASAFASVSKNYTFDNGMMPAAFSGGAVVQGSVSNLYLAPAGDSTYYYVAGPATGGDATLSFVAQDGSGARRSFNLLSLYAGSIDTYNSIQFNFANGLSQTFTGSQLLASASGTTDNRTLLFGFSGNEVGNVSSVNFISPQAAFEFDNVQIGSAVPEPATWAMMILGMGAIGFALRSAKRRSEEKFETKIKKITNGAIA